MIVLYSLRDNGETLFTGSMGACLEEADELGLLRADDVLDPGVIIVLASRSEVQIYEEEWSQ